MWYNSPPILRHLANPLSDLLKDPRSTVVKRTCENLTDLFAKCQVDARYLLKDIMPTILAVHAQTVQVIRSYVQTMIVDCLAVVPCKMAMPLWLDRLKADKSRTVRDACSLYLSVGLSEWDAYSETYLTPEIWTQVCSALIKALRDPSPATRQNSKRGLETVQGRQPDIFAKLITRNDLVKDMRVKKTLLRIQSGESAADDISVGSSKYGGGSVASRSVGGYGGERSISGRSQFSERYGGPVGRKSSGYGTPRGLRGSTPSRPSGIPTNIAVSKPVATSSSTRGATNSSNRTSGGGLGPPQRVVAAPFRAAVESPAPTAHTRHSTTAASHDNDRAHATHIPTPNDKTRGSTDSMVIPLASSFDSAEMPVIASKTELIEVAAMRRQNSRRSSLLQERFARSSSNLDHAKSDDTLLDDILDGDMATNGAKSQPQTNANVGATAETPISVDPPGAVGGQAPAQLPEHVVIAQDLLEAHKAHVDQIMETLKIEMDALKDFEHALMTSPGTREYVTEEEVLEYFESVGLCLDQRTSAGNTLRKGMDRISKGTNGASSNGGIGIP